MLSLVCVAIVTALLMLLEQPVAASLVPIAYLVPVVIAATQWGIWPAALASIASTAAADYFFFPPIFSFQVDDPQALVADVQVDHPLDLDRDELREYVERDALDASADLDADHSLETRKITIERVPPAELHADSLAFEPAARLLQRYRDDDVDIPRAAEKPVGVDGDAADHSAVLRSQDLKELRRGPDEPTGRH